MFDKTLNDKGNICLIKMNVKTMWLTMVAVFIKKCFDEFFLSFKVFWIKFILFEYKNKIIELLAKISHSHTKTDRSPSSLPFISTAPVPILFTL